jgi:hypothetical protein
MITVGHLFELVTGRTLSLSLPDFPSSEYRIWAAVAFGFVLPFNDTVSSISLISCRPPLAELTLPKLARAAAFCSQPAAIPSQ